MGRPPELEPPPISGDPPTDSSPASAYPLTPSHKTSHQPRNAQRVLCWSFLPESPHARSTDSRHRNRATTCSRSAVSVERPRMATRISRRRCQRRRPRSAAYRQLLSYRQAKIEFCEPQPATEYLAPRDSPRHPTIAVSSIRSNKSAAVSDESQENRIS